MRFLAKLFWSGALFLFLAANLYAATRLRPALIRVEVTDFEKLKGLQALGLDIIRVEPRQFAEILVTDAELAEIGQAGYGYEIMYPDFVAYQQSNLTGQLGMGGYHTLDEVHAALDSIHSAHPSITTAKSIIGYTSGSYYFFPIYAMKISDNPDVDEDEPEVFYNSLTHAREPMGMEVLLYFMHYLTDYYGSAPRVDSIVNNRELWFVPVVNPDGYRWNEEYAPEGGGMWRKNLRYLGNDEWGVDLNRNYGYKWGYDNIGSSPFPASETYRGPAPFSEPETQALRNFVASHDFVFTINYHSYGNLLLYAWGYTPFQPPDRLILQKVADTATSVNNYIWGPGYSAIYPTNGDADDWMYGEQTTKKRSLSFTPEVGAWYQGYFWPPEELIIPLAAQNLEANLLFAELAGPLYRRSFRFLRTEPSFIDTVVYWGDSLILPLKLANQDNNSNLYFKATSYEFPNWLVLNPENVTTAISPSDSDVVSLKFSPQGLAIGNTYYTEILLATHNDSTPPLSDTALIPVQVQVLCSGLQMPGDANASGSWTLADAIAIVNYIFNKPGCSPTPLCWLSGLLCRGDWDGTGTVTLGDAIRGVNFIFKGGIWYPLDSGVCCAP